MHSLRSTPVTLAFATLALALAAPPASADSKPLAPGEPVVFKLQRSREGDLRVSPTIIVPTVYLDLGVAGKVSGTKQGGSNTAKAKAHWAVGGLDKIFAQGIAKKIEDDLVAKLRAAGYTVKTWADIKDLEPMQKAERRPFDATWGAPVAKSAFSGDSVTLTIAPSDEQYFKTAMAWGAFNQFISRTKSVLGEGTILIPTFTIAAPQAWATTERGYKRVGATAHVAHGMNLSQARADFMTDKGSGGTIMTTEQIINLNEKVGDLTEKDTTSHAGNAISAALGTLTGTGSIKSSSGYYHLEIDRASYEAAVLRAALAFNTVVADAAKKK
jgi:hypothetical protein